MGRIRKKTAEQRFYSKIEVTKSCWLWKAATDKWGYGLFQFRLKANCLAHRVSYIMHKGEIPEGMLVRHECDTPGCVNPEHLILGTMMQNRQDMIVRGRASWSLTHCPHGHEFTPENTRLDKRKRRSCKQCARERKTK